MGGHTGGGNEDAEAVCPGVYGEIPSLLRGAVGGVDVALKGNVQSGQCVHGLAQDGKIAVAAHDDSDFFHDYLLKTKKQKGRTYPIAYGKCAQTVGDFASPYSMWYSTYPSVIRVIYSAKLL